MNCSSILIRISGIIVFAAHLSTTSGPFPLKGVLARTDARDHGIDQAARWRAALADEGKLLGLNGRGWSRAGMRQFENDFTGSAPVADPDNRVLDLCIAEVTAGKSDPSPQHVRQQVFLAGRDH